MAGARRGLDVVMPALREPAPRDLCTDCGVSRMADAKACGRACQFIRPDYPALEARVHGRARDPARPDELHFGLFRRMVRAELAPPRAGAQWTGIATRLGERLLETGAVDAVLTVAPDPADRWRPVPVLVTDAADMAGCRGMRMGYAPLLALLETAQARGFRRLAVIGIPCQVYALRALEAELGLDRLFVIGTPCSDNTTTERFHQFLALLSDRPETISYLEFRADYHVELRFDDGRVRTIPFLQLPISRLPPDFFPLTCRTCVDYTNVLADITVGYMGGQGAQWLIVRNDRGEQLLRLLGDELRTQAPGSAGQRTGAVRGFLANVQRAAGGLPLRRMPGWLRPIVGWLMPRIGPRGLEFARARVEMKAVETVVHLRRERPRRLRHMVPDHVWRLVAPYGLAQEEGEAPVPRPVSQPPSARSAAAGACTSASPDHAAMGLRRQISAFSTAAKVTHSR
jgi:coenzyme F420 hydrogenase subunit beta